MSDLAETPRFEIDQMLIKLGKYLRCLGYDARWDSKSTREAVRRADEDGRILLTRNTRLGEELPVPARFLLLADEDPVRQLARVVAELALDTRTHLFSRCIRCNVPLDAIPDLSTVRDRVPAGVLAMHEEFFRCPSCGTVFWKGTHVANTCRKLGLLP
jgi:uncharacterized protein